MKTIAENIISPLISIIPLRVRTRLYRLPVVNRILRNTLNRFLPAGEPRLVRITAGPLKGFRMGIKYQGEKFIWLGTHEPRVQAMIMDLVREGTVAYDVGAHAGFFTLLFASRAGSSGKVISFEPNPENYGRLLSNIRINHLKNVEAINAAVSDQAGTQSFQLEEDGTTFQGHLISPDQGTDRSSSLVIDIKTITLDNLVFENNYPAPDILKIDVEGNETRVLAGMKRILEEQRPAILCETHSPALHREVREILVKHSYRSEERRVGKECRSRWSPYH